MNMQRYYKINDKLENWAKDACKKLIKESRKYGIKINNELVTNSDHPKEKKHGK